MVKQTCTFILYLPPGYREKIDAEAAKRNLSRSALLRLAFDEFLKNQLEKENEIRSLL